MKLIEIPTRHRFSIGISLFLSLIFGYFYFYNQFWTHLDPSTFKYLTEYTGSRFRGHRGRQVLVHLEFYSIADQINSYAVKNNLHLIITQSYRPPDKKIDDAIVPPAVKSNHLAGHAIDFNMVYGGKVFESNDLLNGKFQSLPDPLKNFVNDIRLNPGIRWGGDFENQDPVHLDDGVNIKDRQTWERHYRQCVADYLNATPKWRRWLRQIFKVSG